MEINPPATDKAMPDESLAGGLFPKVFPCIFSFFLNFLVCRYKGSIELFRNLSHLTSPVGVG